MIRRRSLPCCLAVALLPLVAPPAGAQDDPCLLTIVEAREVAGRDVAQAAGETAACRYLGMRGDSRLSIELGDLASEAGRARVEELGDDSRFTSRQKGKVTIWLSRDDELAGWVRRGEQLAEVRAAGEASTKRRRLLEHALQRIGERLR